MVQRLKKYLLTAALLGVAVVAQAQNNGRYHTVEEGQTVYSIARLYGISPAKLLALNPNAGDLIKPGDKLILPDDAAPQQQQATASGPGAQFVATGQTPAAPQQDTTPKCKEMYQIKKKDNLYRVALAYNLTIEEIVQANPGLTTESKLKKGEWLCIPYSKAELQAEAQRIAAEFAASQAAAKRKYKEHMNVAIVLPLKENTERGAKMIEFYQGFLMAVDSVRKQGTSIDVYAYHCGNSATDISNVLAKEELKRMNLIFGPLEGFQANLLGNFCRTNKIRMVMPFATTNAYETNNPYVYIASPSADFICRKGVELAAEHFTNANIVIASIGTTDARGASFTTQLSQQLTTKGISTKLLNVDDDELAFTTSLNQFRDNIIVLNNSSLNAMQRVARRLRAFLEKHPEYKVSLLGYPEWTTFPANAQQDFYVLDTYAYASFFRNPTDTRTNFFERRFKANFNHELAKTAPRYGMMGMDMGYYFMHGLAELGDYFDDTQSTLNYSPLQTSFNFQQSASGSAYTNGYTGLVHYKPNGQIEVLRK